MNRRIIIFIICLLPLASTVIAQLINPYIIKTQGTITALGVSVFWESECINPVTMIDWGTIELGGTSSALIFIRNDVTTDGTLTGNADFWLPPEAENELTLSMDYDGAPLPPGEVRGVTITLTADSEPKITTFSFDIIIGII